MRARNTSFPLPLLLLALACDVEGALDDEGSTSSVDEAGVAACDADPAARAVPGRPATSTLGLRPERPPGRPLSDTIQACVPPECTPAGGGTCGDAVYQPEDEDCDASDPDLVEAALCNDACMWGGVVVFVTKATYTGDLSGLDGADGLCQAAAQEAGLLHHEGYRAWLSVGQKSAATRIPLVDLPYYRLDGVVVASNQTELLSGKLQAPINVDETKAQMPLTERVWTNTLADGSTAGDYDCQSFSDGSKNAEGVIGLTSETGEGWTKYGALPSLCFKARHLYCFSAPLPLQDD